MNVAFRLNLQHPAACVSRYVQLLTKVNMPSLRKHFPVYKEDMALGHQKTGFRKRIFKHVSMNNEFRTLHYCAFIHPLTYNKFGYIPNWYDEDAIKGHIDKGIPLYKNEGKHLLAQYVKNQAPFIQKMKKMFKNNTDPIEEVSLVRYEQFMTLAKMYANESLSPPLDVDIVWHAHMLDHEAYEKATRGYFGYILDHNDAIEPRKMSHMRNRTEELWKKHYETPSKEQSKSSCGGCNYYNNSYHHPSSTGSTYTTTSGCTSYYHHPKYQHIEDNASHDHSISADVDASSCASCSGSSCSSCSSCGD